MRFQLLEGQLTEDALLFYGSVQDGLTDYGSLKGFWRPIMKMGYPLDVSAFN